MNNISETITLEIATDADFKEIYGQMKKNFIPEEIRDEREAFEILNNPDYTLLHIIKNSTRVGFISLWTLKLSTFIEHLVIYEEYRNSGIGAKALAALSEVKDSLVLEAEHPISDIQKRRIGFYTRCGFSVIDEDYVQPPYREGDDGVPLLLLRKGGDADKREIRDEIYERIYGFVFTDDVIKRKGDI